MHEFDLRLFDGLNAGAGTSAGFIGLAIFISVWLSGLLLGGVTLAAWRSPALRPAWLNMLISLLVVWLLVRVFRSVLPFPRPQELGLGIQWMIQGERSGFPSMHTAGAFAVAMSLLFSRQRGWAMICIPAAVLVGWSRVFLGLHFPSDVLAGGLLGTWVALTIHYVGVLFRRARVRQRGAGVV